MENNQPLKQQADISMPSFARVVSSENLPQKPSKLPLIILGLITLASVLGLSVYYAQNQLLKQQLLDQPKPPIVASINTPSPEPSPSVSPTGDWKTFTTSNGFSIMHPADWSITVTPDEEWTDQTPFAELVIYKNSYKISIQFLSGFGPGICIFEDHPDFTNAFEDNPIMADSKCPGEFIEFGKDSALHRRKAIPNQSSEKTTVLTWPVYTKDNAGYFATVPPISYAVPENYSQELVALMDEILATFKRVK